MGYNINKLIETAANEIGYLEKASNASLDSKTANAGKNNFTKYWRDLKMSGYQGQPWCLCFVVWCFSQAFGIQDAKKLLKMPSFTYYTPTAAQYFKNAKQWFNYPKVGDVIFFKNSSRICHVGIVYQVDSSKVYTIEGNTNGGSTLEANGGAVAKKSYPLNYSRIAGYGRPIYVNFEMKPALPSGILKKGKKGIQVSMLQEGLNYFGYKLVVDGDFGKETEAAVRNFQEKFKNKYNLEVDGEYGPMTKAAMEQEMK